MEPFLPAVTFPRPIGQLELRKLLCRPEAPGQHTLLLDERETKEEMVAACLVDVGAKTVEPCWSG